jgi:hypothetical protein
VVAATSEQRFWCEELPNRDGSDVAGVFASEFAIDCLVMLAVITDEHPSNVGELCG